MLTYGCTIPEQLKIGRSLYNLTKDWKRRYVQCLYWSGSHVLDRKVAIKILKPELSGDASFIHSFYQEAKSAAKLSHPNIVTIYDFGIQNHKFYMVLEYVPGNDLKTLISKVEKT